MNDEPPTKKQFDRTVALTRQRLESIYALLAQNLPNPNDQKLAWEKAHAQILQKQIAKKQAREAANAANADK